MKIIPQVRCAACAVPLNLFIGKDGPLWIHPIKLANDPDQDHCPCEGQRLNAFDWHASHAAPPPAGPSIRPTTPTPPLAPTPSPAGGSNQDMGHADRSNKNPAQKSDSESGAEKSQQKNPPKDSAWDWAAIEIMNAAGRCVRETRDSAAKLESVEVRDGYWVEFTAKLQGILEKLRGDVERPPSVAEEHVAGLEEVVPRCAGVSAPISFVNPEELRKATNALAEKMGMKDVPLGRPSTQEWEPRAGQCGAYWSDGKVKVGCWYGVGHGGNHSFQEPLLAREKVVDQDVEYWLGMYESADQKWRTAEREREVLRKRIVETEAELAAIRAKGIELAVELRDTKERLAASNELSGNRLEKWLAAEKWSEEQRRFLARSHELAEELSSKLAAAEKQIEIMRGYAERADLKITCLEMEAAKHPGPADWWETAWARDVIHEAFLRLGCITSDETVTMYNFERAAQQLRILPVGSMLAKALMPMYGQKSTRRPEPPREKVREVQDPLPLVTPKLANHIMNDRFGSNASVVANPTLDIERIEARVGIAMWGKGSTHGEAVADAINRWNRGEEAYS